MLSYDRLPRWNVLDKLVIILISKFHSMTLVFLSDHKRILLYDSHIQFIPILSIIRLHFPHHSFILIHTQFHHFTIVSLIDVYVIQLQFRLFAILISCSV